ncbi:MAG: ABC transporter substrate-binding protein [Clostridiales bacterium]|nr:ABC transporter substrate-binding protein [Clostridiales bacterium]
MKKILSLVLAVAMLLSVGVVAFAEDTIEKGTIVYGASTEIGGDFAPSAWWTNNATDNMIRKMINDYSPITTNQGGEYVLNETVAESVTGEMNPDGSKTFTVKINEGLVYNNGEPITAKDFVWASVFSCSQTATDLGTMLTGYQTYVGGQAYHDGEAACVSGIRLIDDYTYSVTIVADKIPYFFDIAYVADLALNMNYWLGDAVELKDDGEGCYIEGLSKEAVEKQLEYARFDGSETRVSAGPYNLVNFDKGALQATFVKNENYAGNFEGQIPEIEKIVIVKAEDATWADQIKTGAFNFYDQIIDGSQINTAMDIIEEGGFDYVQFDRAGYGKIQFQCDFGPTQFKAVRQAIAMLLDRNEFANTFCQGWGGVVNGPYGTGLWQYEEAEEWLDETLNTYDYDPEGAVELLIADGWIYDETGAEWTEGHIRHKKVEVSEAGSYAHNVTLDDGTILMPLIIEWSSSEGNPVSELLSVMLAQGEQTAAAGIKINQNVMTFTELINYLYRDASQGDKYAVPTYGMFNLASAFPVGYTPAYEWTTDPDLVAAGWNTNFLFNNTLDTLSMDMTYDVEAGDNELFMTYWKAYQMVWNELLPDIPLYANVLITMYPDWLEGYEQTALWDFNQAILYCTVAE